MAEEVDEASQAVRAQREQPTRCRCRLIFPSEEEYHSNGEPTGWCGMSTTGPDDPFCDSCTGRHTEDPRSVVDGVVVSTVPLSVRSLDGRR